MSMKKRKGVRVEEYQEEEEYQDVEAYCEEEEYTVKVLKTTLTVTPLETVVAGRMSGNAQAQQLYAVYGYSHGLVQAFASPVDFDWNSCIGSQYGYRENETTGAMEIHRGVDILMAEGTKVKSSMDGIVKEASYSDQYGYDVSIKHEKGYVIRYAHMRSYCVRVGDHVTQGQEIGTSGGMGTTMGSHIHMELMKGSTYMNPLFYVANGY